MRRSYPQPHQRAHTQCTHRYDDDGDNDADGNGISDELEEIEALLWELRDIYHGIFMYYACASGSTDVAFWGLNQWSMFIDDCRVITSLPFVVGASPACCTPRF